MPDATGKIDYQAAVDRIDEMLLSYVEGGGQRTATIGGVSFTYASVADLMRLRAHFAALAARHSPARVTHYAINTRLRV